MEQASGKLTIRHVLVIVTGILVCLGPATLVFNTWSLFVVPVCNDLNVSSSEFTLYVTFLFLTSAIVAPFMGNLMEKFDLRIVITASCALCAIGIFLCAFWTQVWQFYFSGIIEGAGVVALMYLTAPTLVNRWFHTHTGFLIGLCVAMTGVGGALWSMVGGLILSDYGWRTAYIAFGIIAAVISMPATIFFIRSYPSDVGLEPYGKAEVVEDADGNGSVNAMRMGVAAKTAFKSPAFWILMVTIGLCNGTAQMGNFLPKYIYHLGDIGVAGITPLTAIMMASTVAMCLQIAQALGKVGLGVIADKSIIVALATACGCGIIGVLCCWQGAFSAYVVYFGGFMFGFFFASTNVLGPTITRYLFGPREYTKIYSRIASFINFIPAVAAVLFAAMADASWDLEFGVTIGIIAVIFVCAIITVKLGRHLVQTVE